MLIFYNSLKTVKVLEIKKYDENVDIITIYDNRTGKMLQEKIIGLKHTGVRNQFA